MGEKKRPVVCTFCGTDLSDKPYSKLSNGEPVCRSSCDMICSSCGESKKFSTVCYSCKRNLSIVNRICGWKWEGSEHQDSEKGVDSEVKEVEEDEPSIIAGY